jgi:rubrerythrin
MEQFLIQRGEKAMAKFECTKCGHVKEGRCKPQKCPQCGDKKTFEKKES